MRAFARRRHPDPPAPAALEQLAAAQGRPVDEVLREVAEFRLALDADLAVAAAATELDEPVIAVEAVEAGRRDLAAYSERLAAGLHPVAPCPEAAEPVIRIPRQRSAARRRARRALHSTPALVTALVLGAAGGFAVPRLSTAQPSTSARTATASQQLANLETATVNGDLAQATSAGVALHATLSQLVTRAKAGDQLAAHQAATLLIAEQQVLDGLPAGIAQPLRDQIAKLANVLQATVGSTLSVLATTSAPSKPGVLGAVPSLVASVLPTHLPVPGLLPVARPSVKTATKPSVAPAPTPSRPSATTPAAPTPTASSSPSSGASPSQGGILIPSGTFGQLSP